MRSWASRCSTLVEAFAGGEVPLQVLDQRIGLAKLVFQGLELRGAVHGFPGSGTTILEDLFFKLDFLFDENVKLILIGLKVVCLRLLQVSDVVVEIEVAFLQLLNVLGLRGHQCLRGRELGLHVLLLHVPEHVCGEVAGDS